MSESSNTFEYELKVGSGPLDYLSLAIATERHSGQTREIHRAIPTLDTNGKYSDTLKVTIEDADAIHCANKITLCALLPSGGITAQAYLLKDHVTNDRVIRIVQLYTCDYDVRIQEGIRDTISGIFDHGEAEKLLSVEMRAVRVATATAATAAAMVGDQDATEPIDSIHERVREGLERHNKIVIEETEAMLKIDQDVKREVIYTMSHIGSPLVEVVYLRAPQQLVMDNRHQLHGKEYILIKSVTPHEHCVIRSAYFTVAIGNTVLAPVQQYDKCYLDVLNKRAMEILNLVNTASVNLAQAKRQVPAERRTTHNALDTYVQSTRNAHADDTTWFSRLTGLASSGAEPMHLVDYLWIDLMTTPGSLSYSDMSVQTRNFFALFMPLTHGDFGPTSPHDPYHLDQSYLPSKGKLVGMEDFFNADCETLSARCLSYWRAQRDLVDVCMAQNDKIDHFVSGADKIRFMTFVLQIMSLAMYPCTGLIQCTTDLGEHVTHCSFSPMKSWNTEDGKLRDMYTDGIQLREDCEKLIDTAMKKFNEQAQAVGGHQQHASLLITTSASELFAKIRELFQRKDVRVQDCTVPCKTPNSFGFYTKLVGLYPYVHKEGRVQHFAPDMLVDENKSCRDFKQMLEACIANPDKLFVDCGLGASGEHVAELSRCQRLRLSEMVNLDGAMPASKGLQSRTDPATKWLRGGARA